VTERAASFNGARLLVNRRFSTRNISVNRELDNLPNKLEHYHRYLLPLGSRLENHKSCSRFARMVNQMPEIKGSFRDVGAHQCNKTSVSYCPTDIRVIFGVARNRAMIIDDVAR
jgi:hypothetical protein